MGEYCRAICARPSPLGAISTEGESQQRFDEATRWPGPCWNGYRQGCHSPTLDASANQPSPSRQIRFITSSSAVGPGLSNARDIIG